MATSIGLVDDPPSREQPRPASPTSALAALVARGTPGASPTEHQRGAWRCRRRPTTTVVRVPASRHRSHPATRNRRARSTGRPSVAAAAAAAAAAGAGAGRRRRRHVAADACAGSREQLLDVGRGALGAGHDRRAAQRRAPRTRGRSRAPVLVDGHGEKASRCRRCPRRGLHPPRGVPRPRHEHRAASAPAGPGMRSVDRAVARGHDAPLVRDPAAAAGARRACSCACPTRDRRVAAEPARRPVARARSPAPRRSPPSAPAPRRFALHPVQTIVRDGGAAQLDGAAPVTTGADDAAAAFAARPRRRARAARRPDPRGGAAAPPRRLRVRPRTSS